MSIVASVRFRSGSKSYYFDPRDLQVEAGQDVIVETAQGIEFGQCTEGNHEVNDDSIVKPLRPIIRIATDNDRHTAAYHRGREKEIFEICQKKIQQHKLEMKLVRVECSFDGSKILFFFTADERVDFRELVKNLASIFHTRIELRQIGVRDKAKMVGGLGICGRPFCCASFLDDFQPVSIKMAKTQNLSLNPTKISGTCGRLMCCLKYEQDAYEDLLKNSPKAESLVDTVDGRGTVVEVDLLRQRVKVRLEEQETVGIYNNADIAVLRNGKAKKNDPPIPDDLAPISGNGKRKRRFQLDEEAPMTLEPIRMRYSEETIAEEQVISEEPKKEERKPGRNRRRRQKAAVRQEKQEQQKNDGREKAPEKKEPEKAAARPGRNRRRRRQHGTNAPKEQ